MIHTPTLRLSNGVDMPSLGFGVFQVPNDRAATSVAQALRLGYRSIDTAAIYENEPGTGRAIAESGIPRSEVFLTTKLWNAEQGRDAALHAFDLSLERLGVDYVDLYLIHWPVPSRDLYVETWRALQPLLAQGRARALGVSNFFPAHLDRLVAETGVAPAVNQIEFHPRWQPREIQEADDKHGVVTEAWSPLGQGAALAVSTIVAIADRIGRSPAQVVLRWHLDRGRVVIPKSVTPSRIAENLSVTDFTLPAEDLAMIDDLARADGRIGPDPASFVS